MEETVSDNKKEGRKTTEAGSQERRFFRES